MATSIDDDYARMAGWATTVRAVGFDSPLACSPNGQNADPVAWQASYGGGGLGPVCGFTQDTTKAVSGVGSVKDTIPAFSGETTDGTLTLNFSQDGSRTFGQNSEFYIQFRTYMEQGYAQASYLGGSACPAHLTLAGVSGSFSVGELVTEQTSHSIGRVLNWDGVSNLWMDQQTSGTNEGVWFASDTVSGSSSGTTATIAANTGGGTSGCAHFTFTGVSGGTGTFSAGDTVKSDQTSATGTVLVWSPSLEVLVVQSSSQNWDSGTPPYHVVDTNGTSGTISALSLSTPGGTALKQIMIDPQDQPPLPVTSSNGESPNCIGGHFVTTQSAQQGFGESYEGCSQVGGYGEYTPLKPQYWPSTVSGIMLQSGQPCLYANNQTPGTLAGSPCVLYPYGEWATEQYHFKVGHWYMISQPGYPTVTANFSGGSASTGNTLTSFSVTNPGYNWPQGATIKLCGSATAGCPDAFLVARRQNGMANSTDTAEIDCTVNSYGQITQGGCSIVNAGMPNYPQGAFTVRFPPHSCCNFRRDSLFERWEARAGQPSQLVETWPYFDIVNAPASPQDWEGGSPGLCSPGSSFTGCPWPFGKIWFTSYSTGKDPNAGPYSPVHRWIDNVLIGTARYADPGVAVQPVTGVAIDKSQLVTGNQVIVSWAHNQDSHGNYNETGFQIERCPGQIWDCMSGAVSGSTWSTVGGVGPGSYSYTDAGLSASTIYTYRVRATGSANNSDWSTPVTTAVLPPYGLSAQWVTTGCSTAPCVQLTWTQGDQAGDFTVYRCNGVFQPKTIAGLGNEAEDATNCIQVAVNCLTACSLPQGDPNYPFNSIGKVAASTLGSTATFYDNSVTQGSYYTYRVTATTAAGGFQDMFGGQHVAYSNFAIPQAQGSAMVTTSSTSSCDLNLDGVVNILDVQIAIDHSLAGTACRTGGSGPCTQSNVQNAIGVALGQTGCSIP